MGHLPNLITDLALILASAAVVTLIFKKLKQPLVLGYIIAGLMVGPNFPLFPSVSDSESISIWAEIGVIILLFSLGLEFSFKKLMKVGGASSITATFTIITMMIVGYFSGKALGWNFMNSIFLGGILSISSTTIIMRAFEEMGLKSQKFATLVLGVLIIEDLVAILLLVLLSTLAASQQFAGAELIETVLKLAFFLVLWFLGGIFLVPSFLKLVRRLLTDETLLIIALGLCFVMVALAVKAGFSAALGAFIMGSILAETTYAEKIEHNIKPVKNLFGAVFFVSVGMMINPAMLLEYAFPILVLTLVTIFGIATSSALGALIAGQTLKNSIKTGASLSQIGEFSFIIAGLGISLNVTSDFLYPIVVAVSAVTTFTTPYLIKLSDKFCDVAEKILPKKWLNYINNYSSGTQKIKTESDWKNILKSYSVVLAINSVIIIAIILLALKLLYPFVAERVENVLLRNAIVCIISLIAMTPFLWGLAGKRLNDRSYYSLWLDGKYNRGPLVMLEVLRVVLAMFFVGLLLFQIVENIYVIIAAILLLIIMASVFSARLRNFYARLERRFLENLNQRNKNKPLNPAIEKIPWDIHTAEFKVSPESPLIGRTLEELRLREVCGINIGMIERGSIKINIPSKTERLFPGDIITVIGTDEDLNRFDDILQVEETELINERNLNDVMLQQFVVTPKSPIAGKTIREAGIHDKLHGLVVGIEREGSRIANPESTTRFEVDDVVWIVGEENIPQKILKHADPEHSS